MGIEEAAELEIFVDPDEFGATAVISGGVGSVDGIFDDDYFAQSVDAELDIAAAQPAFSASTVLLSGTTVGATATINGTAYTVREIHPDGQPVGMTLLVLHDP